MRFISRLSLFIDAYTRRFLLRLGYEFSDDNAIKKFFEIGLKKDAQLYGWYHWLTLEHCISVCKKAQIVTNANLGRIAS